MNTAEIIKKRREELGLSQEELAEKLGYKSRSSINKIELGLSDIPFAKIPSFAKALNIKPEVLMGWEDETIKLRNKVVHGIKLTEIEKLNFLKQLVEKMTNENFTEKQIKSLLEIKDLYRLVWELQFDEELMEKAKTNKELFKILSDINVETAKYHFKKEGLSFDNEDEQIHRETFEDVVTKNYLNSIKKDLKNTKSKSPQPKPQSNLDKIMSQLTADELIQLEKFNNMSTVMFMNEGNNISDEDKETLAMAYAEVLISQRKK